MFTETHKIKRPHDVGGTDKTANCLLETPRTSGNFQKPRRGAWIRFSLRGSPLPPTPQETNPANTMILNIWSWKMSNNKFLLFWATRVVRLCYGSPRTWIRYWNFYPSQIIPILPLLIVHRTEASSLEITEIHQNNNLNYTWHTYVWNAIYVFHNGILLIFD